MALAPVEPVVAPAAPAAIVEAPVAAVAVAEPAPAVVAEPAPAPAADVPAPGAAPADYPQDTVLGAAKTGDGVKVDEPKAAVVEAPKADAAKPGDVPKPAEATVVEPVAPVAYDFKFPETLKPDAEKLTAITDLMRESGISPEVGQKLVDSYISNVQAYADHTSREQWRQFGETRKGWRDQIQADPEIGGAGHQTAMKQVATARDLLVKPDEMASFNEFLLTTGAGDHPWMNKLLYRAARYLNEPVAPSVIGTPSQSNGNKPGPKGMRSLYQKPATA